MLRRELRYYWRAIAATMILVVVGIMAISIMVTQPSFKVAYTGDEMVATTTCTGTARLRLD